MSVAAYHENTTRGGGLFYVDLSDTISPSDGGSVFVTQAGERVKRLGSELSVADFGAVGDGVRDDTAAFENALRVLQKLNIGAGRYKLGSLTIKVPLYFSAGAQLIADEGAVITINRAISSHNQQIFGGLGSIVNRPGFLGDLTF